MNKLISTSLFLASLGIASLSQAAITVTFSGVPAEGTATISIDQAEFEISSAANFNAGVYAIIDDAFTNKTSTATANGPALDGTMQFTVNGTQNVLVNYWQDGGSSLVGGMVTPNDMIFGATDGPNLILNPGDIVSISGELTLTLSNPSFEIPSTGDFEMFLINGSATTIISENAVPEPSTVALFSGLGALGFVLYRRRK